MILKLALWILRRNWSVQDRTALTNTLLKSVGALPLRAVITADKQRVLIHGKPVSADYLISLRTSAETALSSTARNLIHDQVRFIAIDQGFLQSADPTTQLFYKAALWFSQEETDLLKQLAGNPGIE